ncbi:MAG TPA: hypothetical protein VH643_28400 [Gemmataceae bacterium]
MTDYLDREQLLALDIDPASVERLLARSPLSGHGGRPVVPAESLADLLGLLERDEDRQS